MPPEITADLAATRPLRADAERNRRLILDAARAVFAERGLDAGFDEIARQAGVGVGTVYRRFPERDDLIEALFSERLSAMAALAREALEMTDAWEGLCWFFEQSISQQSVDRGLKESLGLGARAQGRMVKAREEVKPAVEALVARAHEAGVLRPDVHALDLAMIANALSQAALPGQPELWRRYLRAFLDGISATHAEPLPGRAPTDDDFEAFVFRT